MHFEIAGDSVIESILKPVNSHSGPKLLVNELVSTEIAYRIGLPAPEPYIVDVPPKLEIPLRHRPGVMAPGPNFAVPYFRVSMAPAENEHIALADNQDDLPGIVAFDTWMGNRDRTTPGNLVATPSTREPGWFHIWMVDHGHAFTGPNWTAESLLEEAESVRALPYPDVLAEPMENARWLSKWLGRITAVDEETVTEVVEKVPLSWLPQRDERRALVTYIVRRRDFLVAALAELSVQSLAS